MARSDSFDVRNSHEKRPEVSRKKGDGNGVTGKEKKREVVEKISGSGEGG